MSTTFKDISILIKPHPNEDVRFLEKLLTKNKNNNLRLIQKADNTQDLIHLSNIIITTFSTSGLESIIQNKPLITINVTCKPDLVDYSTCGPGISVKSQKALIKSINMIFNDITYHNKYKEKRDKYLKEYSLDGNAHKRISSNILMNLCNNCNFN